MNYDKYSLKWHELIEIYAVSVFLMLYEFVALQYTYFLYTEYISRVIS